MAELPEEEKDECQLYSANGLEAWCTCESCIYWRLLEPQDIESGRKGCGLQHYGIVDNITPDMARWLLEMKKRLENTTPEAAKSRITFRRREE